MATPSTETQPVSERAVGKPDAPGLKAIQDPNMGKAGGVCCRYRSPDRTINSLAEREVFLLSTQKEKKGKPHMGRSESSNWGKAAREKIALLGEVVMGLPKRW